MPLQSQNLFSPLSGLPSVHCNMTTSSNITRASAGVGSGINHQFQMFGSSPSTDGFVLQEIGGCTDTHLAMEATPSTMTTSTGVPIPPRRNNHDHDFGNTDSYYSSREYNGMFGGNSGFGFSAGNSSVGQQVPSTSYNSTDWGVIGDIKMEMDDSMDAALEGAFRMDDEDDIFQVDKADLIQGPTLAELNANDETLLEDLSFDDILLPEEKLTLAEVLMDVKPIVIPNVTSPLHLDVGNSSFNSSPYHMIPGTATDASSLLSALQARLSPQISRETSQDRLSPLMARSVPSTSTLSPQHTSTSLLASSVSGNYYQLPPSSPHSRSPLSPGTLHPHNRSPLSPGTPLQSHNRSPMSPGSGPPRSPLFPSGGGMRNRSNSALHDLLVKREAMHSVSSCQATPLGQSVPKSSLTASNPLLTARLSSSAPTHLGLEQLWQRREPRQHLVSTGSLLEAESTTSSLSTVGDVLSPLSQYDLSHDEEYDSECSDHYEDLTDDADSDSDIEDMVGPHRAISAALSKKERYFWQYNVQAKGPKGQRLVLRAKHKDPHVLNEITDPVFSPQCAMQGIKHSGKARKGDGNDLNPNPRKLFNIGKELDRLSKDINDMTPVTELPFNARSKSRKEKNKLASRACRLKKKAQHEANKVKLHGLALEHKRMMQCIAQTKQLLSTKCQQAAMDSPTPEQGDITRSIERVVRHACNAKYRVAGHSTDFVNRILDKLQGSDTTKRGDHFN